MEIKRERDRDNTEERLINAVGELIIEVGFENLGINQVAKHAGFSKNLIYRYFDSLDGLIYAYMKKHDFWANITEDEKPDLSDVKGYLKAFFRRQIVDFRGNIALKRLRRWELSTDKEIAMEIRKQREKNGVQFNDLLIGFVKIEKAQAQAIAALVNAGITYLAILEENCRMYNGIDIQSDEGWQSIAEGVDVAIDMIIK